MRNYLLNNALKIVLIGAVLDVIVLLMREFVSELAQRLEFPFVYTERLGHFTSVLQLIAYVFFWLAMATIIIFLEDLYRARVKDCERTGP